VTWYKRAEGSLDPTTGDRAITWTTEIITAIVQRLRADEVFVEAGYAVEDYVRIFTISAIQHKDKIGYGGVQYEAFPPEVVKFRGVLEHYTAICRRLIA